MENIQVNLMKDLKGLLLGQLQNGGFRFNRTLPVDAIAKQYFNIRISEIYLRPRKIHFSKQFSARQLTEKQKTAIDKIIDRSRMGKNLAPYVSKDFLDPENKDPLLFDWKIHHLHLGTNPDISDPRFIERTGDLLYVRVDPDDMYLIDVLDHDKIDGFANKSLIEIIHQNWPQILARWKCSTLQQHAENFTNQQIHVVREKCAMIFITVSDGTVYMPSGGGYAANGTSMQVVQCTNKTLAHINFYQRKILDSAQVIRDKIIEIKGSCPTYLKIRLQNWDEHSVQVLETKTNIAFNFY